MVRRSRQQRRVTLRETAFPASWVSMLKRNVPVYVRLPSTLRHQLHGHIQIFLAEKDFEGCGGLVITDEIRVTIAAQACLLLLNRETTFFPGVTTILVYPETYVAPQTRYDGVVESVSEDIRAGESWHRGPVVLSWADVMRGTAYYGSAHNVVLHEFAHKLDEENEHAEGLPTLADPAQQKKWAEVLGREYLQLQASADRDEPTVLDHYGATSPSEFFAVATETFFETPIALKQRHPQLYEQLGKFYNINPASWRGKTSDPGTPRQTAR